MIQLCKRHTVPGITKVHLMEMMVSYKIEQEIIETLFRIPVICDEGRSRLKEMVLGCSREQGIYPMRSQIIYRLGK